MFEMAHQCFIAFAQLGIHTASISTFNSTTCDNVGSSILTQHIVAKTPVVLRLSALVWK